MEHRVAIDEQQMLLATFFLRDAAFGLDAAQVQEVVRLADITPVHRAPNYVVGVMNLRGRIATVIDLATRLQLGATEVGADSRILIIEWRGEQIGLLVDRVADASLVNRDALRPSPENVCHIRSRHFKGVFHIDGTLVALLDTAAVLDMENQAEATAARGE